MFGNTFDFQLMRKYVALFGSLFSNINIHRYDLQTGEFTELIKVPLTYSPKDKMIQRVTEDPDIDKQTAIQLPLMAFEMDGFEYDGDRKLETMNRMSFVNTAFANTIMRTQYNPVPYDFSFKLHIFVKNASDGTAIVETILPYFTPDYTLKALLIPEMNDIRNIPIILESVERDDKYDGKLTDRRTLIWTLGFNLKGWVYGPVVSQGIIKFVEVNFRIPAADQSANLIFDVGNTALSEGITVQPGLTANGQPTWEANNSISPLLINVNDDYGFCEIIREGTSNN